jgi:hypothetical protein
MIKLTTGEVRLSYVHLSEPKPVGAGDAGKIAKFETGILIRKDDAKTLATVQRLIDEALEYGRVNLWGGTIPKGSAFKLPLHDGDTDKPDDDPAYKGCMFLTARTNVRPWVLDRNKTQITNPSEIYSGMYGHVILTAYPFSHPTGSKGVGIGLEAVLKTREGERLGSSAMSYDQAASLFGDFDFGTEPDGGGFL